MLKKWFGPKREEGTFASIRDQKDHLRRRTVILLLISTALVGWLYLFFGSGMFRVSQVTTDGLVHLDRGEVEQAAYEALDEQGTWPWQWRNLLLVDADRLSKALQSRLYAESVAVEKSYPNILRLKIEERQSSVIVLANNELYLIDHHGIGTERISNEDEAKILERLNKPSTTSKTDLPILTIRSNALFAPGAKFVDELVVQEWLQAFHELTEAGFGYRNAVLEHPTSTKLILNLFEPYDAYIDLLAPTRPQIESFYAFTKAKTADMVIKEYVDLRIPGKVYYQ